MKNLILSLLLLLLPYGLMAQNTPEWELGKWWKNSEIVQELQLSKTQVAKIEQSFMNHRVDLSRANNNLKSLEGQIKILMNSDHPDKSAVVRQSELITTTRAELSRVHTLMMLSIREHLTQEQWRKLSEIRETRKAQSPLVTPADTMKMASGEKVYIAGDPNNPIKNPVALYMPWPSYTDVAKEAKIEGTVLLQAIIRKDGTVDTFKVLQGLGYGLDESAITTVAKRWKFSPGTLDGRPVSVQANIEISFRLY
jgi:TonB family protein